MDFFKSILADDPEPENVQDSKQHSPSPSSSSQKEENREETEHVDAPDPSTTASGASRWSFGGLIQTLASRSESVLETYRRDLEEFGTGLKKETVLFREVASRAVKELPASIEVGASVAQGSLGSVGKTIDGVFKSTADIISQGKDTLLASSDAESETPDTNRSLDSRRYSRFDAQLTAIQNDPASFTEEPEDLDDYRKWKSEFNLNDQRTEFEDLIGENGGLEGVYKRLVPSVVDEDTFWCRYFYRVHKLKQQESVRASLVMRAISVDDEEELTWDVDDEDDTDDDEPNSSAKSKGEEQGNNQAGDQDSGKITEPVSAKKDELQNVSSDISDEKGISEANADKSSVTGSSENKEKEVEDATLVKSVEKGVPSGKQNDVCEQQPVQEEEDFGWDEIGDIDSGDEKKVAPRGESANIADVRKRLAEDDDDENLSWDIEDDDEPIKA
nr:BSD domain-containing protein 1 [Ipomoea batatas]